MVDELLMFQKKYKVGTFNIILVTNNVTNPKKSKLSFSI